MALWKPGESGNPKGKKKGTPNRLTAAARQILDDKTSAVLQATVDAALEGDTAAQRIVLGLSLPRRIRPALTLPALERPQDVTAALIEVTQAAGRGDLEADEVRALVGALEAVAGQHNGSGQLEQFFDAVLSVVSSESPVAASRIIAKLTKLAEGTPASDLLVAGEVRQ